MQLKSTVYPTSLSFTILQCYPTLRPLRARKTDKRGLTMGILDIPILPLLTLFSVLSLTFKIHVVPFSGLIWSVHIVGGVSILNTEINILLGKT